MPLHESPQPTTWHGQDAWTLENDALRLTLVPAMGAKIVSLFDKRNGLEWLVGPGERPFRPASYGAVFTEQDMSGWDEMFPTIVACEYPVPGVRFGAALPDHGEVWAIPWRLEQHERGRLTLSATGRALPYRLTRAIRFLADNTLEFSYRLDNLGSERLAYLWAAHPQFVCGLRCEISLPPQVKRVVNVLPDEWGWGAPETSYDWPAADVPGQGAAALNQVGPPGFSKARKFFAPPEISVGWAVMARQPTGAWLRLEWQPVQPPYFGLWIDEGAFSAEPVVAFEPMTGYYDSLALAWKKREVRLLEADESAEWTLTVRLGPGADPAPDAA